MRPRSASTIVSAALLLTALAGTSPATAADASPVPPPRPAAPEQPVPSRLTELEARGHPAWGTEPVPQGGSGRSQLADVSLLSADEAWAVGSSGFDLDPDAAPLVERWDGSRWSVVEVPGVSSAVLNGVVAVDSDDVWMIGAFDNSREALILHWNGTRIEQVAHPNPGGNRNDLYAVTATGPDDVWAVGSKTSGVGDPLALHWDGRSWEEVAVPGTASSDVLSGVTALSPDEVWAVGELAYEAASVRWDGEAWTVVDVPVDGSSTLAAVSASAPDDVWAVGQDDEGALAVRWTGSRWRVVDTPDSGGFLRDELLGVAALAPDDAWAVGDIGSGSALALHWNGRVWTPAEVPGDGALDYARLHDVAGTAAGDLLATGALERRAYGVRLEADGLEQVRVEQVGTGFNQLLGISAVGAEDIWAVGGLGEFDPSALTLHYDGDRWRRVRAPAPPEGTLLQDVVAISGDDAWAVGATNPGDFGKAVALHWDGRRWQRVKVPQPGGEFSSPRLLAVDATGPDDVWAVGAYDLDANTELPLVLHWNGTRWREVQSCGTFGGLAGVTFLAPDDGWVVSHSSSCHWDGRRWTFAPTPHPRDEYFEVDYQLEDVSFAAPDDGWTVGTVVYDFVEYVDFGSLAFHWDGSAWQRVVNPSGVGLNAVEALAADDVWAVGRDAFGPLIVRWNGGRWIDVPTPDREDGLELEGLTRAGDDLWDAGRSLGADDGLRSLVQRAPSPTEGALLGSSNVGGATVSWTGPENGAIETAPTGEFQLGGLPAGRYRFTLAYEGCTPVTEAVEVIAGRTRSIDLQADCD